MVLPCETDFTGRIPDLEQPHHSVPKCTLWTNQRASQWYTHPWRQTRRCLWSDLSSISSGFSNAVVVSFLFSKISKNIVKFPSLPVLDLDVPSLLSSQHSECFPSCAKLALALWTAVNEGWDEWLINASKSKFRFIWHAQFTVHTSILLSSILDSILGILIRALPTGGLGQFWLQVYGFDSVFLKYVD